MKRILNTETAESNTTRENITRHDIMIHFDSKSCVKIKQLFSLIFHVLRSC